MKIKEITSSITRCELGACPGIFETNSDTFIIIGKKVDPSATIAPERIGPDESMIEVPAELIKGMLQARKKIGTGKEHEAYRGTDAGTEEKVS